MILPEYKPKDYPAEYRSWVNMRSACYNATSRQYPTVGAKGIVVGWKSFNDFMHSVGPKPDSKYILSRINHALNFTEGNCRWASSHDVARKIGGQARRYTWNGQEYTIAQAAACCGVSLTSMNVRLTTMPIDRAMTVGKIEKRGRTHYGIEDIQCTCRRVNETDPLKHEGNCRKYNTVYQRMCRQRRK